MLTRTWLNKTFLFVTIAIILSSCTLKKTGYVDVFKLVGDFELQKEYTEEAKREINKEKAIIDSVVYVEKLKSPATSESLRNELYTRLYRKTEERNKEIEAMIWKRLNPYIVDFGKEKGYIYIYGANGTGNVLYADESQDITPELTKYVNQRYHDKK
ncbi:MAG TPA: OmpH family outer membrane protein [Flavipsychrobacter sp.]|nr:OmpH family outer membrane protein [Flavipsychrobacter sp.]